MHRILISLMMSLTVTRPCFAEEQIDLESMEEPYVEAPAEPPPDFKRSETDGEKTFDWKKYEGATEVPHPFAEKGLTRISKDRTYWYKVDQSEQRRAFSLRVGIFNPENLENPDQSGLRGATFDENYDQASNPAVMFDYEWQLWQMAIGKIGLRAGTGIFIAQGNGHFASEVNQNLTPREIFTFWAAPTSLGAVYRLQFWDKQLLVPYGEGGGMAIPFGEFRDDDRPPKWGGAFAAYFAGGLAINLTYFDAMSTIQLDREYGINRVFLTAEYRQIIALTQTYDFSSALVNGGLLMEF